MKGNALIGQSGGPTSVINASLAGVIQASREHPEIQRVLGLHFGIEGLMEEKFYDLGAQSSATIEGLLATPSSALGSSRHKVKDSDLPRILEIIRKYDVRWFFLIGGNDTMDTIHRVTAYCRSQGYELTGVGIPKTVDNDLFGTDHTPGFGSAARSNILNVQQAGILARDRRRVDRFVVYQTIGRDAGWLAAATALARQDPDDAPHLICMPERPFDRESFLARAKAIVDRIGWVSVVCGEGIRYADGTPVSASTVKDKFNNVEYGSSGGASAGLRLHGMLSETFGWRGEFQITESLIMCDWVRSSERDRAEARQCGIEAVRLAAAGKGGVMVTMERKPGPDYAVLYGTVPLADVAVRAKPMPDHFINAEGTWPTPAFLDYCRPLVGELPRFARLEPRFFSLPQGGA